MMKFIVPKHNKYLTNLVENLKIMRKNDVLDIKYYLHFKTLILGDCTQSKEANLVSNINPL